mgnify:CR=1 FL=1
MPPLEVPLLLDLLALDQLEPLLEAPLALLEPLLAQLELILEVLEPPLAQLEPLLDLLEQLEPILEALVLPLLAMEAEEEETLVVEDVIKMELKEFKEELIIHPT